MKRSYVFLTTENRDLFFETMKELGYDYRTVSRPTETQVELVIENIAGADLGEIKSRMIRLGGQAVSDGESPEPLAKSERAMARGMQKKGYSYILLIPNKHALYTMTIEHATKLLREDLKHDSGVEILMISKFLS